MKDIYGEIQYKDKTYKLVFNLNVMETIQEEYGSVAKWAELTEPDSGEPDIKAVIFGLTNAINEGIEIENDDNGTDIKPLTKKQVGRIITEYGLANATQALKDTVIKSTKDEKNA